MLARLDVTFDRSPVNFKEKNGVRIRTRAKWEDATTTYVGLTDLDQDEDIAYAKIPVRQSDVEVPGSYGK